MHYTLLVASFSLSVVDLVTDDQLILEDPITHVSVCPAVFDRLSDSQHDKLYCLPFHLYSLCQWSGWPYISLVNRLDLLDMTQNGARC